ncbi:MAG: response regulator [Promethearchaeota archaeon]
MIEIYIVEDFKFNIRLFKAIFETMPEVNLHFAEDGREGFEMIKNGNPDIIILDYKLPNMYGTEICKELRKVDRFKSIPIIVVSSSPIKRLVDREEFFKEAGFSKLFPKPFKAKVFLDYIKEVISIIEKE